LLLTKAEKKLQNEHTNRLLIISTILGYVFSVFMVSGRNILLLDTVEIGKIKTWIKFLCGTPFWASTIILLMTFQLKSREIEKKDQFEKINLKQYFLFVGELFLAFGLLL
jgi:hypothetical protein